MKKKLRFLKSNSGTGLPTAIIVIAFIAIMGSILLTISFTNYNMKQTNFRTKDSFYSAEQALDEVNIGLQNIISIAISNAYLEVLENYSLYDIDQKNDLMESIYFTTILDELQILGSSHKKYRIDLLNGCLQETKWGVHGDYGAFITSDNPKMETYADSGIVLKDIEICYQDAKGYVSVIHTDIRLVLPDLVFSINTVLPNIANYTLIADENLVTGVVGTNQISGEIYAGGLDAFGSDPAIGSRVNLDIINNTTFVVKEDIHLQNINFTTSDSSEIWANDLLVDSSSAIIDGTINLADDTNLRGKNSEVVIRKVYNGYGNSLDDASESSAILVNGINAVLNIEECKIVTIAGHAYIGTKNKNIGPTGTEVEFGNDVLMGESVSVKSNQLLYLVPPECIGVNAAGNSLYNKNPLTESEYNNISPSTSPYTEVDQTVDVASLGSTLEPYIKLDQVSGKPEVEKVFVTSNTDTLVYYYLKFKNEDAANQYFYDYYNASKELLLQYMNFYTDGIQISNPELILRMQLAGNMMKYDKTSDSTTLQTNTLENASGKLESASIQYTQTKDALCTKLVSNYAELTNVHISDLSQNIVFDNIVDETALKKFFSDNSLVASDGYVFSESLSGPSALLIDNSGGSAFVYDASASGVHLIIATGDVKVNSNFSGLILSNGEVTLANNVDITANSGYVKEALSLSTTEGGIVYSVIGFFWDRADLLNEDGSEEYGSVKLADLVVYENWKKE